jgi:hypothetical protein
LPQEFLQTALGLRKKQKVFGDLAILLASSCDKGLEGSQDPDHMIEQGNIIPASSPLGPRLEASDCSIARSS